MSVNKYSVFLKALELGSLTAAADALGYTQSGVSQMINSLESQLDVNLLSRSRQGLSLTPEGELLLPYIRNIHNANIQLEDMVMDLKGICKGHVRIGAFHSVACHILPPLIKDFKEVYPDVEFELLEGDFTELETYLANGRIDMAFMATQYLKNYDVYPIIEDKLQVIIAPDHPYADAPFFPWDQLTSDPFIYLDEGKYNDSQLLFKPEKLKPSIKYHSKEDNTILSMVANGLGIAVLPELVATNTVFNIVRKDTERAYFRTLGIAVKDKRKMSNATKCFVRFCLKKYRQDE